LDGRSGGIISGDDTILGRFSPSDADSMGPWFECESGKTWLSCAAQKDGVVEIEMIWLATLSALRYTANKSIFAHCPIKSYNADSVLKKRTNFRMSKFKFDQWSYSPKVHTVNVATCNVELYHPSSI
jgi:hypothetical protein